MTLTTAQPAAAGVYWQAVIYTGVNVTLAPEAVVRTEPNASVAVRLPLQVEARTPCNVAVKLAPKAKVIGSSQTTADVRVTLAPRVTVESHNPDGTELEVTPTFSASMVKGLYSDASLTVAPTFEADTVKGLRGSADLTVTPILSASAFTGIGIADLEVAPAFSASVARATDASLLVNPEFTAAVKKTLNGSAPLLVTPQFAATATVLTNPLYDNSASSSYQSALASGSAFTWSHTAAGSPYAIVAIFATDGVAPMDLSATAVVKFGSTTLTPLGSVYANGASSHGFGWVFGANNVPSGPQTVSVTLTESGKTFSGYGVSYTYNGVSSVGTLQTNSGNSASPSVAVPTASGDIVWGALFSPRSANTWSAFSLTQRQTATGNDPVFISGGLAATGSSVTVSATMTSWYWGALGLNLI